MEILENNWYDMLMLPMKDEDMCTGFLVLFVCFCFFNMTELSQAFFRVFLSWKTKLIFSSSLGDPIWEALKLQSVFITGCPPAFFKGVYTLVHLGVTLKPQICCAASDRCL